MPATSLLKNCALDETCDTVTKVSAEAKIPMATFRDYQQCPRGP